MGDHLDLRCTTIPGPTSPSRHLSSLDGGNQRAIVRRATGEQARSRDATGEVLLDGASVSSDATPD